MESMQQSLIVLGVLALLAALLWYLRAKGIAQFSARVPLGGSGKRLQQIERLSLTPQHSLHMVRVAGQAYLLVLSPAGCTVVGSCTWTDPKAEPPVFQST